MKGQCHFSTIYDMLSTSVQVLLWLTFTLLFSLNVLNGQGIPFEKIQANKSDYSIKEVRESYMNHAGTLIMNDVEEAIKVYKELQLYCRENENADCEAECFQAMAESYYMMGIFDKAIPAFQDALVLQERSKNKAQVLIRLGGCYALKELIDSSNYYYKRGVDLIFEINDTSGFARAHVILGQQAFFQEKYVTAVDHFEKAVHFCDFNKNASMQKINALKEMAVVYAAIDDYKQAVEYCTEALDLANSLGYKRTSSEMHKSLGMYENDLGNYELAKIHLLEAIPHFEEKKLNTFLISIYSQLALAYIKTNDPKRAESYIEKSKKILPIIDSERHKIGYYLSAGQIDLTQNKFDSSEKNFKEAWTRSIQSSNSKNELETIRNLIELYKKKNDLAETLFYTEAYHQKRDSIFSLKKNKIIYDYEARYTKKAQEESINDLNSKNELQELQLKQKQRQLWASSLGLLALLCIIALTFIAYRIKNKNEKALTEKNIEINRALDANKLLLKEIHHRVKNNLQVVSSLLNLQSRQIKDPSAKEAIKAGQNRIKSMALIHQNLYQDEDIVDVDSAEYIENLVTSLIYSYHVNEEKVKLVLDVEKVKMNVDSVIPIGLILNELISNSLKYGLAEDKSGTIYLSFKKEGDNYNLNVRDEGIGLPKSFSMDKLNSLGFKIISSFTQKLKGELIIENPSKGTSITVKIPSV